ncbi:MAG: trehalose-phosphatase [Pseudomonadota bacterium]
MTTNLSDLPVLTETHALFLDFDGTLAPIQNNPDDVFLPKGGESILRKVSDGLQSALVIISGRDVRDLTKRVPIDIWRAGSHGLEICRPNQAPSERVYAAPGDLIAKFERAIAGFEGIWLEVKGKVFAVHYRQAPDAGKLIEPELRNLVSDLDDYVFQSGKMVFEAKPKQANKGIALSRIAETPLFKDRKPIMIGDDRTDEDAMRAAVSLGGVAIKVGEGTTVAELRLKDPADVWNWLKKGFA